MFEIDFSLLLDKTALIQDDTHISYAQLQKRCDEFAKTLPKKRQLIILQMRNTIDSVVAYLSSLREGHVIIMLDFSLSQRLKESIYQAYQPNLIYSDKRLSTFSNKEHNLHKDLSILLSTSGSTGSSKMIRLTHKNINANSSSILHYLPINSDDITITTLPLYYSYGLSVLNTHLLAGATVVLSEHSVVSKDFWYEFDKHSISNLNGVPYHYEMLRRLGFLKKEHKSLRFLTQAGGKLNNSLIKEFGEWAKESQKEFYVMYGQSEATARISYLPPKKLLDKIGSIGVAIPEGELSIENSELIYKGENVMMGYSSSFEDLCRGDELNGVLKTGDLGYMDSEGYFFITGRAKRFVKLFGNRVNLDEIEQSLKDISDEIAVIGKDENITVLSKDTNTEQIKKTLLKRYGFHHSILHVKSVENLIYKNNSKIDYQELTRRYL
jgi:acyl-CoA synthetase (AMP-forming)/AMP-acid ligase II